jgi:polysaccharide biosynthesis protein PslG
MVNTARVRTCALSFGILFFALMAVAQNCPTGMETHYQPSIFPTLSGEGICHFRLWDNNTAWVNLETSNGVYNWSTLDTMISEANKLNSDVLYTFGKTPTWASSNPTDPNCKFGPGECAPPSDVNSGDAYFKAFVTALMEHAGTEITSFEMWNEPYNLPYWDGTPQELEIMVSDAAQIILSYNPNAIIITPSISSWPNQQVFLANFLAACQGNVTFDVFGMHDYTWGGPAEKVIPRINSVKAFQVKMGLQSLPLWGTEGSDKEWATFTQQEKDDYVPRYLTLEINMGSLRHYWYSWNDATAGLLVNTPAAITYATTATWLTGRTPLGCVATPAHGGDQYVCTMQDSDGTNHQIVWLTNGSGTFATTASSYETDMGVVNPVVNGSVPINDAPIFILQ